MILRNACVGGKTVDLILENGRIAAVTHNEKGGVDLQGRRVIPGLIDVHTHGCGGMEVMDAQFEGLCRYYAERGTTSFLATTGTMPVEDLIAVCDAKTDYPGAHVLGVHLEGPYISMSRKGAQNPAYIRKPDVSEFDRFHNVKMITVAPEVEGGLDFIKAVSGRCSVALGHTDCDYETALAAIDAGANNLTHTFNAMPPFLHRAPGPVGAAVEKGIYAQMIGDGYHVQKPMVLAAYRMFGPERLMLISDSLGCAGLPNGHYTSIGMPVELSDDVARLPDGTVAGSRTMLFECVKRVASFGVPFDDAVRMASRTPAELLGVNKGRVEVGFDADLLILDENCDIEAVIIDGEVFSGKLG